MKNKEVRELQLPSSVLAGIFIGILVFGIIIFLLGVSVGKKHSEIAQKIPAAAAKVPEVAKEKPPLTAEKPADLIKEELASHQRTRPEMPQPKTGTETKSKTELKSEAPPPEEMKPGFYLQVGAFLNKESALLHAERFKKQGHIPIVLDPLPTDKKTVFRVLIGVYKTREEAEAAKQKLDTAAKKRTDYFIIRNS